MLGAERNHTREGETLLKGLHADDEALDRAEEWARGVLAEKNVDARKKQVLAVKELRAADRRLSLVAAKVLVDRLNGRRTPPERKRPGFPGRLR